jgi:hypothetical protein
MMSDHQEILFGDGYWGVRPGDTGEYVGIRRRNDGSFIVDNDPSGQVFINGFFRLAKIRALEIWHSLYGQN